MAGRYTSATNALRQNTTAVPSNAARAARGFGIRGGAFDRPEQTAPQRLWGEV
jgi:hypothetical protein